MKFDLNYWLSEERVRPYTTWQWWLSPRSVINKMVSTYCSICYTFHSLWLWQEQRVKHLEAERDAHALMLRTVINDVIITHNDRRDDTSLGQGAEQLLSLMKVMKQQIHDNDLLLIEELVMDELDILVHHLTRTITTQSIMSDETDEGTGEQE